MDHLSSQSIISYPEPSLILRHISWIYQIPKSLYSLERLVLKAEAGVNTRDNVVFNEGGNVGGHFEESAGVLEEMESSSTVDEEEEEETRTYMTDTTRAIF